jgi:hypothetical protein
MKQKQKRYAMTAIGGVCQSGYVFLARARYVKVAGTDPGGDPEQCHFDILRF